MQTKNIKKISITLPKTEVNEQIEENKAQLQTANGDNNTTTQHNEKPDIQPPAQRPPLLETPTEYEHQNNWDMAAAAMGGQMSEQDWNQQMSNMPWQNANRMGGGGPGGVPPPPPRPPFPMQFPYGAGVGNDGSVSFRPPNGSLMGERGGFGGRGGGRGWMNSPQNQFRNFPRPPRGGGGSGGGGGGGSPYFNRGGGRGGGGPGGMRGGAGFRGKFRGKNNWI